MGKKKDRIAALEALIADKSNSKETRKKAKRELAELQDGAELRPEVVAAEKPKGRDADLLLESDENLRKRVKAKQYLRSLGFDPENPDLDLVPRDDPKAIAAWNLCYAEGRDYLTAETPVSKKRKKPAPKVEEEPGVQPDGEATGADDAPPSKSEKATKKKAQVAEVVETETGREFAVGEESEPDGFAVPSALLERDRLGRPYVVGPDGKRKAYTRTTTYIDCLEDTTMLEKWKLRVLLEGVVVNDDAVGSGSDPTRTELYSSQVRDLIHRRDVELKKIAKADRKGKIEEGERGPLEEAVWQTFKSSMNGIAEEALELGGVHEKAQKGTDLHAIAERYDLARLAGMKHEEAIESLGDLEPSDRADLEAYAAEMARCGIEVVATEKFVVDDEKGVAGTLDRLVRFTPQGAARRTLAVGDLKTGRVDYGQGKIGMQIREYAGSRGYDPANPEAREDLKASKTVGLLIHLPQGSATCTIYEVDLKLAEKGLGIAGQVRAWRNEGKRTFNPKSPYVPVSERPKAEAKS